MKVRHLSRYSLSVGATAALLAGCGGAQPSIGTPGAMPQSRASMMRASGSGSWMLPAAKREALVYVSNPGSSTVPSSVYVYSYPAGKIAGILTGFGSADDECVDKRGNVFIADTGSGDVEEYAHGGSEPINSFTLDLPYACAVDPTTGDLAVTQLDGGNVYVYPDAQGAPTIYTDTSIYYLSGITYDGSGNLFVDGSWGGPGLGVTRNASPGFAFLELSRGSNTFKTINLSGSFDSLEPMQWDGKYLGLGADGKSGRTVVDRIKVTGTSGKIIRRVLLARQGRGQHTEFWIQNGVALQSSNPRDTSPYFESFTYPGGNEIQKIKLPNGERAYAWGITVTDAPR